MNEARADRSPCWPKGLPWLVAFCLCLCHVISFAQTSQRSEALEPADREETEVLHSLEGAIEWALINRLDMRISRFEIEEAKTRVRDARARQRPRLGFSMEFSNTRRWDDYAGIAAEYEIPGLGSRRIDITSETPRYLLQPVLEASYSLYNGGGDRALLNEATSMVQASEFGSQEVAQRVILDVARQYLALRRSCVNWKTASDALLFAKDKSRLNRARGVSGRLADIELRTDELSLLEARQQQLQRDREVEVAYARYVAAVLDHPGEVRQVEGACHFNSTLLEDLKSIKSAARGSPQGKRYAQNVVTAKEQLAVEKASRLPKISLFARYGHVGRKESGLDDLASDLEKQEAVFGVRFSYELYDGGLSHARVDAARLNLQKRQLAHEDHMARMARRIFDQRARQQRVEQALVLARSRYELAESRFSLSEKRFRAGQESALARLESQLKKREAFHALELAEIDKASVEIETHYLEASSQMENNTQE